MTSLPTFFRDLVPISDAEAKQLADAVGLKQPPTLRPARWPAIPPPAMDLQALAARDPSGGLMVDVDGFARADVGIPEMVAFLGPVGFCSRGSVPGFSNLALAPLHPDVARAELETKNGELIGLCVDLAQPSGLDLRPLIARFGQPRAIPGPVGSFEAGADAFDVETAHFRAQYSFSRRSAQDPIDGRQIHRLIYRRTATDTIGPDSFDKAYDLARLVRMVLRPQALQPSDFAGAIGVLGPTTGDRVAFRRPTAGFGPALTRNVADASIVQRHDADGRAIAHLVEVAFMQPVDGAVYLGPAVQRLLGAEPAVTTAGEETSIAFPGRGVVRVRIVDGRALAMTIERA